MITWYRGGQSTFSSCDHVFQTEKVKMDKSAIGQKHQRIKLKADKTPKKRKYFNTPTVKVYDPMITWYRGGQSTFSSCDHAGRQRKAKMDKSAIRQKYQRIKLKVDKTSKKRKYFNTPTIKVYDPMITWYSRGQSTFSSCDHVGGQRKAKMDKNAIGQKQQRITLKVDKSPKKRKYFNTPTIKVYDHMIIWYRGRQSTFSSCDYVFRREKSKNGQMRHRTEAPKDETQSGQNPKKRKYFNTPTIKVYVPLITWYIGGQSTFSSCDHVGRQRKAKMDKSAIGQKYQRIKLKVDKTSKKRKYFNTPTIKVYDQKLTWYRGGQSTFSSCDHVGEQRKAKMDKSSIGQKPQRIKLKADKTIKKRKYFNTLTIKVRLHDHMIQGWTINIFVMRSRGRTEKSNIGQKRHRTKATKDPSKQSTLADVSLTSVQRQFTYPSKQSTLADVSLTSVQRQFYVNWRWTDVRLTSANVDCLLG